MDLPQCCNLETRDLPFYRNSRTRLWKSSVRVSFRFVDRRTSMILTWKRHDDWENTEKNGEEISLNPNTSQRKQLENFSPRTAARKSAWFIKSSECMQTEEEIWSYVMWNIINLFTVLFRLAWIESSKARFITDLCSQISLVFDLDSESSLVLFFSLLMKQPRWRFTSQQHRNAWNTLENRDRTCQWLRCVQGAFTFIELHKPSVNICWPVIDVIKLPMTHKYCVTIRRR